MDGVSLVSKTVIGVREWLHFLKRFFRFLKDVNFFQCTHVGFHRERGERTFVFSLTRQMSTTIRKERPECMNEDTDDDYLHHRLLQENQTKD